MTNMDLSSLFTAQQTSQIDWDGPLYSLYELPTTATSLALTFVSANSPVRQGIRLKARGANLTIDGVSGSEFVLWQDTAPDQIDVDVTWNAKGTRSLRVWNCWEHNGAMHAWLGNAGIRVDDSGDGLIRLRCSDGEGDPDFDNLVVEVRC